MSEIICLVRRSAVVVEKVGVADERVAGVAVGSAENPRVAIHLRCAQTVEAGDSIVNTAATSAHTAFDGIGVTEFTVDRVEETKVIFTAVFLIVIVHFNSVFARASHVFIELMLMLVLIVFIVESGGGWAIGSFLSIIASIFC